MDSHKALAAVRETVTALEQSIAKLTSEIDTESPVRDDARADLTKKRGLERLGEASAADVEKARATVETLEARLSAAVGARDQLTERLAVAQRKLEGAKAEFLSEAAHALKPEFERLRAEIRTHAHALGAALRQFAQVDATVARIPLGTRTGTALIRAAGDPFAEVQAAQQVTLECGFPRDLPRLTETEILALTEQSA